MARTAPAAAPRAPGLLRAPLLLQLLLLLLLLPAGGTVPLTESAVPTEAPLKASELRCRCSQTWGAVNFKHIQSVTVTSPGLRCSQTEVIALLNDGRELCLNPEAPLVKKVVDMILNKGGAN